MKTSVCAASILSAFVSYEQLQLQTDEAGWEEELYRNSHSDSTCTCKVQFYYRCSHQMRGNGGGGEEGGGVRARGEERRERWEEGGGRGQREEREGEEKGRKKEEVKKMEGRAEGEGVRAQ